MSYILYSSIARAGGIDLYLGVDSLSHPPLRPVRRRAGKARSRWGQLRRRSGQSLIRLGEALSRWGRHLASPAGSVAAPPLTLVAE